MTVKITGLKELNSALKKLSKETQKEARKAARKSLNAGAKEVKQSLKTIVPTMKSSTNFREKGVLKKNIRHKTKLSKDGSLTGKTSVFFSDKNATTSIKPRERTGRTASGKLKTGPIKIYVNDPYFWHMVDRGTVKGVKAQNFMKRTEQTAKDRALRTVGRTLEEELKKVFNK